MTGVLKWSKMGEVAAMETFAGCRSFTGFPYHVCLVGKKKTIQTLKFLRLLARQFKFVEIFSDNEMSSSALISLNLLYVSQLAR